MDKKARIALITTFVIAAVLLTSIALAKPSATRIKSECNDKIDNDGDGYVDLADGGCDSRRDTDETDCGDGVCEGGETSANCVQDCGQPDSCSDTDGGYNIWTSGNTSGYFNDTFYGHVDYCVDSSTVNEYYCSGDYEQSNQTNCGTDYNGTYYCDNATADVYFIEYDYFCTGGECGVTETPVLVEDCQWGCTLGACDPQPESCTDTDGGVNWFTTGTVFGWGNETQYNNTDSCNGAILTEWYCGGTSPYSIPFDCGNMSMNCSNGACV